MRCRCLPLKQPFGNNASAHANWSGCIGVGILRGFGIARHEGVYGVGCESLQTTRQAISVRLPCKTYHQSRSYCLPLLLMVSIACCSSCLPSAEWRRQVFHFPRSFTSRSRKHSEACKSSTSTKCQFLAGEISVAWSFSSQFRS